MTPERHRQIGEIFDQARDLEPRERSAFLHRACAGDDELRHEVESLLDSEQKASGFLAEPAMAVAARLLAGDHLASRTGRSVGHYDIRSLLGEGGMGEVYLADDTILDRKVAIKFLSHAVVWDERAKQRLLREARAAARLDHPNICPIHEVGTVADESFIVMPYLEGVTLKQLVGDRPLPLDDLLSIALQIASALAAAHAHGIVHRDFKSSNIVVSPDGHARVLDFGLAKLVKTDTDRSGSDLSGSGTVIGTPEYMSPEQARGEPADVRSDIFSFGVVLYEMATGNTPFKRRSPAETMAAVINEPHTPARALNDRIPPQLMEVIDRALAKAPEHRFASMDEAIHALRRVASEMGALVRLFDPSSSGAGPAYIPLGRRPSVGGLPGRTSRLSLVSAAVVALAALAGVAAYILPTDSAVRTPERTPPIRSIAILPFKPLVADNRDEALEMGMADTLITRLSNVRAVVVRPMSAVRRYSGLEQDPVAAGREQGVDAVLDGSIQRSGERVRITVRLMSVADGRQIWAERFEERFTDIFSVQDAISTRVGAALAVKLTGAEEVGLAKRYTESPVAYQHYLKGRYFAARWTQEGYEKGIDHFKKAIEVDPNYALAYDGLAYCYYNSFYEPFRETMTKGRAMAKKALELDPELAEAHVSLGLIHTWLDYDWSAAEREFHRAIELKPNYAPAHIWFGWYLQTMGRVDDAVAEMGRAVELDPLSAEADSGLGVALFYARRYDEAAAQLRRTLELAPDFWFARMYLARAMGQAGDWDGAIVELEHARAMEGASTEVLSALGYAYGMTGRRRDAVRIVAELEAYAKTGYVPPYNMAVIFVALGDRDRAFAHLDRELREGAYYLNLLKVDPELDGLRADSRFEVLLQRMKLAG